MFSHCFYGESPVQVGIFFVTTEDEVVYKTESKVHFAVITCSV